jgi:hypothetical protein
MAEDPNTQLDADRAARAANLFDLRRLIGGLFVIYGLILIVLGLGDSQAEIDKAAGININLYAGLGMLAFGLLMLAWGFLRPLSGELEESEEAGGGPGGDDDSTVGSRAAGG